MGRRWDLEVSLIQECLFKLVPTVHAHTDLPIAMSASPPSLLLKFSISFKTSRLANYPVVITGVYQLSVLKSHHHIIASLSASNQQSVLFSCFFFFYRYAFVYLCPSPSITKFENIQDQLFVSGCSVTSSQMLQGMPPPRLAQLVFPHANRMTLILTS